MRQGELRFDSAYFSLLMISGAKMRSSPGDNCSGGNFPLLMSCLTLHLDLYLDLHFNED